MRKTGFLILFLAVMFGQSAFGQVDVQIDTVPVDVLRLSDFDPLNPSATSVFFIVTLSNDFQERDLALEVLVTAERSGYLGSAYVELGNILPNSTVMRTNQEFESYDVGDAAENLVDYALKNGVLPPDEYVFTVNVIEHTNGGDVIIGEEDDSIITTNPTTNLDLVGPGTEFLTEPDDIASPQPLFQWLSNASQFNLSLYEVRPGQLSPEDVATNLPVFTIRDLSSETYAYPSFGEQLVNGKIYAWQVNAIVNTAAGPVNYPSEMFWFRYTAPGEDGVGGDNVFVNRIVVEPQETTIEPGQSIMFRHELLDANDSVVLSAVPEWRVVPDRLGQISEDGLFTAGDESGAVAIVASYGDTEDYATVLIRTQEEEELSARDTLIVQTVLPFDGQEFFEPAPDFVWQVTDADSTFDDSYVLTVWGPLEDGNEDIAPMFWQHNVSGVKSTTYPSSVPGLQPGNRYAFTVTALDARNNPIATSERTSFSISVDPKISWEVLNAWDVARRQQTDSLLLSMIVTVENPPLQQSVRDDLVAAGGIIETASDPWVQLSVPFHQIENIAAVEGISLVSLPSPHVLFNADSGEALSAPPEFKPLPGKAPVKVAIFEFGFDQSAITSLVGGRVTYHSFRADGEVGGSNTVDALHGLASTQALFEYLPRTAEVHLINFDSEPEFKEALSYAINDLGVDLISCSVSWANAYDHYDGTSFFTRSVVDMIDDDATFIVAAGNFAQSHWEGAYQDNNLNGAHDFSANGDYIEVKLDNRKRYTFLLSWDEWGKPARNLDIEVLNENGERLSDAFGRPYASRNVQSEDGYVEPVERIRNFQPFYPGVRTYRIRLTSPNRPSPSDLAPNFELYIYPPPESSLPEADGSSSLASGLATARSNSIIPVGASNFAHSSQGPTNDGRVRPDFSTSGVVQLNQAVFEGTSFATPRVTAVIASIMSMQPDWSIEQVSEFLQRSVTNNEFAEKDNTLGWGNLDIESIITTLGVE